MLTDREVKLLYQGIGYYKGWRCIEIGSGRVIMSKGNKVLKASKDKSEEAWVEECWKELKRKIDEEETL